MKRALTLWMLAAAVALTSSPASAAPRPLRVDSEDVSQHPEVELTVTVPYEVAGGAIPTEAFAVYENGEARTVAVEPLPGADLEVIVVLDTTGSMGGGPIRDAKTAATSFLDKLPSGTTVSVLAYDTKAYRVSGFSRNMARHAAAISRLTAGGKTALYDAVSSALGMFATRPPAERAIVLLTDGEDNASRASLERVTADLTASGIRMFGVEYKTAYTDTVGLREMVSVTGGRVVRAGDPQGLVRVYGEIAAELSNQYRLSYTSSATGMTDVAVKLSNNQLSAQGGATLDLPAPPPPNPGVSPKAAPRVAPVPRPAPEPQPAPLEGLLANRLLLFVGLGLVFGATALMTMLLFTPRRKRRNLLIAATSQRQNMPKMREGLTDLASHLTDAAEKSLTQRGFGAKLNAALERAGINLRPAEFAVLVGSLSLAGFALGSVLANGLIGTLTAVMVLAGAKVYVSFRGSRRQSAFADQLNDTLQLLAGSLRAGYGMMQAIDSVAREAASPTAEEFSRLVVEARLGRDLTAAMEAMGERIGSEDFEWVIQAISIHREVGGDLAQVLDTVAGTIRERGQIRRQIKALSAEGKLSGVILTLLPLAVAMLIGGSNPDYMAPLFQSLAGIVAVSTALLLMVAGGFWMRHFINLKF